MTATRTIRNLEPLPLMGRGRGGVSSGVGLHSNITPSQPSPIEGEGIEVSA
jgi:hypothetical protein